MGEGLQVTVRGAAIAGFVEDGDWEESKKRSDPRKRGLATFDVPNSGHHIGAKDTG